MSDDIPTTPTGAITPLGGHARDQLAYYGGGGGGGGRRGRPHGHGPIVDVAQVLGIPQAHLTPQVQAAITTLMGDIEALRAENERLEGRETWLDDLAGRHPTLPLLNRRGLQRELTKLLQRVRGSGLTGTVVSLHAGGIETVFARHGLAAGEAALHHVAQALGHRLRQTDPLAMFDGGVFVVVLTLAQGEQASSKAGLLASGINAPPFRWGERSFPFAIDLGRFRSIPSAAPTTWWRWPMPRG